MGAELRFRSVLAVYTARLGDEYSQNFGAAMRSLGTKQSGCQCVLQYAEVVRYV